MVRKQVCITTGSDTTLPKKVFICQDPIGLAGGDRFYGYIGDTNKFIDIFGLLEVYRGVNENHQGYSDAQNGIVKPKVGMATPEEHNAGNTNSEYTSWTTNKDVAINYALRPEGNGVVLTADIPESSLVESPNKESVLLKQGGGLVSEDEVLVQGEVKGAKVESCSAK